MLRIAGYTWLAVFTLALGHQAWAQLKPIETPPKTTPDAVAFIGQVVSAKPEKPKALLNPEVDVFELDKVLFVDPQGKQIEIVKDDKSKMFFKDGRVRNRTVRIWAVPAADGQPLSVQRVESLVDGKAFDVDYWCEKCKLSYLEPGICICCGAQVELRELPSETPFSGAPATTQAEAVPAVTTGS